MIIYEEPGETSPKFGTKHYSPRFSNPLPIHINNEN